MSRRYNSRLQRQGELLPKTDWVTCGKWLNRLSSEETLKKLGIVINIFISLSKNMELEGAKDFKTLQIVNMPLTKVALLLQPVKKVSDGLLSQLIWVATFLYQVKSNLKAVIKDNSTPRLLLALSTTKIQWREVSWVIKTTGQDRQILNFTKNKTNKQIVTLQVICCFRMKRMME